MNLHRPADILPFRPLQKTKHQRTLHNRSLTTMLPAEMEKGAETSRHSSRSARTKRELSPSAKERKTKAPKSVKLQEPHKRKEKPETTEEEAKDAQIISSSTVVNVDSVREWIKDEREELLALLETEGPGEGKSKQAKI